MRAWTLCGCIVFTGVLAALPSRIERATIATPVMSWGANTSDSVDARTRAALLAARDAIWRAWFANDTASLARLLPRSTTAGEQRGWQNRDEILADARGAAESGQKLVGIISPTHASMRMATWRSCSPIIRSTCRVMESGRAWGGMLQRSLCESTAHG